MTPEQATIQQAIALLTPLVGPPVGKPPQDMQNASIQYVIDHLACSPADFDAGFTADFVSAALVERNTGDDPSEGAPIYSNAAPWGYAGPQAAGTPLGTAYFDAAVTTDGVVDVFAFKGTDSLPSIRHAIANYAYFINKVATRGVCEVWGWKKDGSVWNLKTGQRIGESVIVSGRTMVVS